MVPLLREAHRHLDRMVITLDLIAPHVGTLPSLSMTLPYVDYFMPSIEEAEIISKLFGPVGN